jgi:predicted transposase YbfD/YdcC
LHQIEKRFLDFKITGCVEEKQKIAEDRRKIREDNRREIVKQ